MAATTKHVAESHAVHKMKPGYFFVIVSGYSFTVSCVDWPCWLDVGQISTLLHITVSPTSHINTTHDGAPETVVVVLPE